MKKKLVVVALLLLPPLIFYFFVFGGVQYVSRLPFYGPRKIEEKAWHGRTIQDTLYFEIPAFSAMLNDSSQFVSDSLDGRIYLASFVDLALLNDVPKELTYMIFEAFKEHNDLQVITYFFHYEGQTISRPKQLSAQFPVDESQWKYIVNAEPSMQTLHDEYYFVHDEDVKVPKDPFSVVLIDKEKRIRGYYNPIMAQDVKQLKEEITHLKKEYGLNYKTHKYFEYDKSIEQKFK